MNGQVKLYDKTLASLSSYDKEFRDMYMFCRKISSTLKNPILLNYKSRLQALAKGFGIKESTLRIKIGCLRRLGLASVEGNHLRLYSYNQERKDFGLTLSSKYFLSDEKEMLDHYYRVILRNNIYQQKHRVDEKNKDKHDIGVRKLDRTMCPTVKYKINEDITLSALSVCKLLDLKSTGSAFKVLARLSNKNYLVKTDNKVEIEWHLVKFLQRSNLLEDLKRVRKVNGVYYWQFANIYDYKPSSVDKFIKKSKPKQQKKEVIKEVVTDELMLSLFGEDWIEYNISLL